VGELPQAVREAYEAEIRRLEKLLETASDEDATRLQEAIGELEAELVVEDWPIEDD
jgi:hypothetical protein